MKLSNMLFSSQVLGRGTVRHFSDGDFAIPVGSPEGGSYIESLRLRRPPARRMAVARKPAGRSGFRSLFR
jgi:hypothetical protein